MIFKKLLTVAGIVTVIKADFVDVHHFLRGKRKRHKGQTFSSSKESTMDFKRVKEYFAWLYYQYQIISCCAVMEPWEQSMLNTILLTMFAMVVYTAYVFIPIHIRLAWEFFSKLCGYHSTTSS